ncbi:SDR family oxidoreductase [Alteromonas stellipolaris]|uniref:SDR family oxidoreductase n=2 Tax=Alteromonas stellipolaris TaxID=233316 RepID=A0AAW7Z4Z4_9ALTE|nr:SDR family oxidoreductase [Alteromonas stellipolaris]MDO6539787.1 SDR family oxidoreductase [Alteromonas stellipolaris]MDO6579022.1 SDR family oxidoreductase [Alteromonas stellipolaris]MDP2596953.1 SDR family oxidoreductase [Alteromonas stellipolaris]
MNEEAANADTATDLAFQESPPVALITGAAKRIGATMAKTLHSAGYRVIVHYGHSAKDANALVNSLNNIRPNSAICLQADLCKLEDITRLAEQATAPDAFSLGSNIVHALGSDSDSSVQPANRINVLINNASSFYPTPLGDISANDWQSLVGSNVQGPLFLSQALWPALKASHGCIINMVDMHIDRPLPHHTVYGLAKTALASITRSLAVEMAPEVRVNGIAPGAILWPERELEHDQKQRLLDSIPLGGLGSPEDIANTATFLILAKYITGQIIYVDGGRSLHTNASA